MSKKVRLYQNNQFNHFQDFKTNNSIYLINCVFISNKAFENGAAVCIFNNNSKSLVVIQTNFFIKNTINLNSQKFGSTLYLLEPGDIIIENSTFQNNEGFLGASIFYSETRPDFVFYLKKNVFFDNFADLGGAGIYFQNKFDKISPSKNNLYYQNKAPYGSDYTTRPIRFQLLNSQILKRTIGSKIKNKIYVVPGKTEINLIFQFLDYYGEKITSINQTSAQIELKKSRNILQNSNFVSKIDGKTNVVVSNGLVINFNLIIIKL